MYVSDGLVTERLAWLHAVWRGVRPRGVLAEISAPSATRISAKEPCATECNSV
jgi:hypothetical protein